MEHCIWVSASLKSDLLASNKMGTPLSLISVRKMRGGS